MPRRKPLIELTKDIEKKLIKGRKQAAKNIVNSLTEKGPWWTGTFGKNWIVSKNPVKPTRKREQQVPYFMIPFRTGRQAIGPPKRRLTAKPGAEWYDVYIQGGFIHKDITLAFQKVGFTNKVVV